MTEEEKETLQGGQYNCKNVYKSYYCNDAADMTDGEKEYFEQEMGYNQYHWFKNCWFMVLLILVSSVVAFSLSWVLHELKMGDSKPYKYQ